MLTFKSETIEDIEDGLSMLWRLPRRQRIDYLSKAKNKLTARARRGDDVRDLHLRVQRIYAKEKERYDRQKKSEGPEYKVVDKGLYDLQANEATYSGSERYRGLLVVHGKNGYYATDGTNKTGSYSWCGAIPDEEIEEIVNSDNA